MGRADGEKVVLTYRADSLNNETEGIRDEPEDDSA
jgi:hypothetical protein